MSEVLEKINEGLYEYEKICGSIPSTQVDWEQIADKLYWTLVAAQGELVCAEKGNCKCEGKCKD